MKGTTKPKLFPKIMGIVNITQDSFSDGGEFDTFEKAFAHSCELIKLGSDIIDFGGESTRPNALGVDTETEINRVIPVISEIKKQFPQSAISIDTTKYKVAELALDAGASIINDISGLTFEPKLADLASERGAAIVLMHIQGEPRTMQNNPSYVDVVAEIYNFLEKQCNTAIRKGVKKVYIDPGIGFGKNLEHNLEILRNVEKFKEIAPVCLGVSRKSMFKMMLGIENPSERDLPTLLLHTILLDKDIDMIRVHNVRNFVLLRQIYNNLYNL